MYTSTAPIITRAALVRIQLSKLKNFAIQNLRFGKTG